MGGIPGVEHPRPRGDSGPASLDDPLPDGQEAPPPGVRAMATVRWSLVALMALAAAGAWVHHLSSSSPHAALHAETRYHCPMHPSIVADHPGGCPICGMDLVPFTAGAQAQADTAPSTAAPGPGPQASAGAGAKAGAYWCPMHPEIGSDDPNATCPKCGGMKLLPRPAAAAAAPAPAPGVPGLTAIELGPERVQLIGVRTAPVTRERLAPSLRALGLVTPAERGIALVTTRFAGWIDELRVAESGRFVRKGEVLARISSPELEALQVAYLNAVQWGKQGHAGAAGSGTGSGDELYRQTHERMLRAGIAEADLREIARRQDRLPALGIYAPVSGFVGRKSAVTGLYVQPGTELYEIVDLSTVWVVADVYDPDIGRVKVGQPATITLPSLPQRTFHGRVEFLYPAVSPGSRTLQARIGLANPQLELRPGMYADVALDLGALDARAVPTEAVVDTGLEQYVFVARPEGRFEPRRVRLGTRAAGKVELLEGPAEGEQVVTTAQFLLDSESRLRAAIGTPGAAPAAEPATAPRAAAPSAAAPSAAPPAASSPAVMPAAMPEAHAPAHAAEVHARGGGP